MISIKSLVIIIILVFITTVSANEGLRFHQFNRYVRQAKKEKNIKNYQKAFEAIQKAEAVLDFTVVLKSLKQGEVTALERQIGEIKGVENEEIRKIPPEVIIYDLPSPSPIPTQPLLPIPTRVSVISTVSPTESVLVHLDQKDGRYVECQKDKVNEIKTADLNAMSSVREFAKCGFDYLEETNNCYSRCSEDYHPTYNETLALENLKYENCRADCKMRSVEQACSFKSGEAGEYANILNNLVNSYCK